MSATDLVTEHVFQEVLQLSEDLSAGVAETVGLAMIEGAAKGLMLLAHEQGREDEVQQRIHSAVRPPAPSTQ